MKDAGFFLGIFAVIIILAISTAGRGGIFSGTASSTTESATTTMSGGGTDGNNLVDTPPVITERPTEPEIPPPTKKLSDAEIERRLASLYRELEKLGEALRAAKLREPASPYVDMVDLRIASARSTDPRTEYLTIRANTRNTEGLNVSGWYLASYVTEESATIPKGDRILERWRSPARENIVLLPGEEAYLYSGDSPIDTSFRENKCTGYLATQEDFSFSLSRACPRPIDEMEKFGNIALDNDTCYDFVKRIGTCVAPDDDAVDAADLNRACTTFIENTLNHDDCVAKHRLDPLFDNIGKWHIYLERDEDLWRKEREIIRLMDENDLIVAVVEY